MYSSILAWTDANFYGDHQRFIDTYFSQFDGKYFMGAEEQRWIILDPGRVDDVVIVSGHNFEPQRLRVPLFIQRL